MTAVKHPQFHLFKRNHVGDQRRARVFPLRTTRHKRIFYHPLTKRLTGDTRRIAHAGQLFDFIQRLRRDRRDNPINHG